MKRLLLPALAFSMLVIPVAHADYRAPVGGEFQVAQKFDYKHRDVHKAKKKVVVKRNGDRIVVKKKVDRHHWSRGKRVPDWNRRHEVRDYHRYGLRRPGHGQRWIKVDNDYLLIGVTSGVIASIIAGR